MTRAGHSFPSYPSPSTMRRHNPRRKRLPLSCGERMQNLLISALVPSMTRWSSTRGLRSVFWSRSFLGSSITWPLFRQTSCIYAATMAYLQMHHVRGAPQGRRRSIASIPSPLSCVHGHTQLPRRCTSSSTYVNPERAYKLLSKALSERHTKAKLRVGGA